MNVSKILGSRRFREFAGVLLFGVAVILAMSILSYDAQDPSYLTFSESPAPPRNLAGRLGATLADLLFQALGMAAYLVPLLAGAVGVVWFARREWQPVGWRAAGHLATFAGVSVLLHLLVGQVTLGGASAPAGGLAGLALGRLLVPHLNVGGTVVLGGLLAVLGLLAATRLSLRAAGGSAARMAAGAGQRIRTAFHRAREGRRRQRQRALVQRKHARERSPLPSAAAGPPGRAPRPTAPSVPPPATAAPEPAVEAVQPRLRFDAASPPRPAGATRLPPLDLLALPDAATPVDPADLEEKARQIVERCAEFGVNGEVMEIHPGPVVTTFEFRPEPGVKYSRITGLVDDLCLALRAESILIDRIPGKSTVGIEVPNRRRETISLREILSSPTFQEHSSALRMGLGKGVEGEVKVADLADMPHLLIAGSTGSGKSVTLNALLTAFLYTATPDQVKFIMVDTKRLELGIYEDIPHLITPVVTEPKKAANALRWAVAEMERRYKLLADASVRSIAQYNRAVRPTGRNAKAKTGPTGEPLEPIPYIVVIIDELADLMLTSAREVEESIMRLAQMARAVGIHLILSTQRPSVDVITGVIKANLPSRMALRVTSRVDSRTILDGNGAEKLLGMGDMLFIPPRSSRLVRIHGPYVSERESLRLVNWLKEQARPTYDESVTADPREEAGPAGAEGAYDEMYDEAVRVVVESRMASTSQLQRRLRLGFARAGRIMDMMEADGIVGPQEGSKPRQVLVGPEFLREFEAERRD